MLDRKSHVTRFAREAKLNGISLTEVRELKKDARYISIIRTPDGSILHGCDHADELVVYITKFCPSYDCTHVITIDADRVITWSKFDFDTYHRFNLHHEPVPNSAEWAHRGESVDFLSSNNAILVEVIYDFFDLIIGTGRNGERIKDTVNLHCEWLLGRLGWEAYQHYLSNNLTQADGLRYYDPNEIVPHDKSRIRIVYNHRPYHLAMKGSELNTAISVSRIIQDIAGIYAVFGYESVSLLKDGEVTPIDHTYKAQAGDTILLTAGKE